MLDVAHDLIRLHALDQMAHGDACKYRVFPWVLKQAAVAGVARKVYAATNRLVITLVAQFAADDISVKLGCIRIP